MIIQFPTKIKEENAGEYTFFLYYHKTKNQYFTLAQSKQDYVYKLLKLDRPNTEDLVGYVSIAEDIAKTLTTDIWFINKGDLSDCYYLKNPETIVRDLDQLLLKEEIFEALHKE